MSDKNHANILCCCQFHAIEHRLACVQDSILKLFVLNL